MDAHIIKILKSFIGKGGKLTLKSEQEIHVDEVLSVDESKAEMKIKARTFMVALKPDEAKRNEFNMTDIISEEIIPFAEIIGLKELR